MKQITFSDSQWNLMLGALIRLRLYRYTQWIEWRDSHRSMLLAGLEEYRYKEFLVESYAAYKEVAQLMEFCYTNARDVEEGKA